MAAPNPSQQGLISQLEPDSELRELLGPYIADLPSRASALESSFAQRDWTSLATLAHRLKGTAGSFGFPLITDAARELEDAVEARRALDAVRELVEAVAELCRRAEAARSPASPAAAGADCPPTR